MNRIAIVNTAALYSLNPRFQRSRLGSRNRTRNFAPGHQNISG